MSATHLENSTRHGAVVRTEVNRAVVAGVGRKVTVVRVGEPVPKGVPAWLKGMAVRATARGRSAVGIITGLKSRATVVVRAGAGTVEVSARRLRSVSYAKSVLLMPATRAPTR